MRGVVRIVLFLVLLVGSAYAPRSARAWGKPVPGPCADGVLPHGALSRICIPSSGWNGDLVVWAHGYVDFTQPISFYHLSLPDGTYLPDLVQQLGFAFATTSYRQNGLAVLEGVEDIRELVKAFRASKGAPPHTYLVGVSEGGLITALLAERSPNLFSGALAAAGPIGDFRKQLDYISDFHVLFDYFFPNILPPWNMEHMRIPKDVIANWDSVYVPKITAAITANPSAASQLIRASKAAIGPGDPSSVTSTILHVMWYNVFGNNDAVAKLGGNPYDNQGRWYSGSDDDLSLNRSVARFRADRAVLAHVDHYQTSGRLTIPLVTMHTTRDEIIPFWHEILYAGKVHTSGHGRWTPIPVERYGHSNFRTNEAILGLGVLILQVAGQKMEPLPEQLGVDQMRSAFVRFH